MMVRFHTALAASHPALPSHCSRQDTPSSSARLNRSFDSEDDGMLSSSQFVDHIFFPSVKEEYNTSSPSRISIQPAPALVLTEKWALPELQLSFVVKATRMPMRPWEETLFNDSLNNYSFFAGLHNYLFTCIIEVSALSAESLFPISAESWRACTFPLHKTGFVLCLIFDFCNRLCGRNSESKTQIGSFL